MDLTCDEEMLPESDTPCGSLNLSGAVGGVDDGRLLPLSNEPLFARPDLAILHDPNVLPNMLKAEEINLPSCNYFKNPQSDITPEMRRAVTTWMYEVCEEEKLPENVFLRAVNYLDRFLNTDKISRNQFQLLGAVCLLISSKWNGSIFSISRLSYYTANSCTTAMILEWEMLVLTRLKWDTYFITPADFVDHILPKLPGNLWNAEAVKDKTKTYTAYCATDDKFCIHPPSMIASASIAAAIGHIVSNSAFQHVLEALHQLTHIETDLLKSCMEQLRTKIGEMVAAENSSLPGVADPGHSRKDHIMSEVNDKLVDMDQAETPTDVHEINF